MLRRLASQSSIEPVPEHSTDHAHFDSLGTTIESLNEQSNEFIHPNGPFYWTCSTYPVRLVSDFKPPLPNIQPNASNKVAGLMRALNEIPETDGYQSWEIYTDGTSCVFIDHHLRATVDAVDSPRQFKNQLKKLTNDRDIETSMWIGCALMAALIK